MPEISDFTQPALDGTKGTPSPPSDSAEGREGEGRCDQLPLFDPLAALALQGKEAASRSRRFAQENKRLANNDTALSGRSVVRRRRRLIVARAAWLTVRSVLPDRAKEGAPPDSRPAGGSDRPSANP